MDSENDTCSSRLRDSSVSEQLPSTVRADPQQNSVRPSPPENPGRQQHDPVAGSDNTNSSSPREQSDTKKEDLRLPLQVKPNAGGFRWNNCRFLRWTRRGRPCGSCLRARRSLTWRRSLILTSPSLERRACTRIFSAEPRARSPRRNIKRSWSLGLRVERPPLKLVLSMP